MKLRDIIIVAAVAVGAIIVYGQCRDQRASEWQQRAEAALARAEAAEERAFALKAESDSLSALAANLAEQAEAAEPEIRERIITLPAVTPPALRDHPAITARDEIIAQQGTQIARWKTAYENENAARLKLLTAFEERGVTIDSLTSVIEDRPGDRPWWLPRLGVGPGAGLCSGDQGVEFCKGVQAHLSWEIGIG